MYKVAAIVLASAFSSGALGVTVTVFSDGDEWKSAVGHNFTTIDFTGGENFAFINDDYADQGIVFSSNANYWNSGAFVNDNWGMEAVGGAWLTFDTPQHWIAADHPGLLWIDLYYKNEWIYTSPGMGGGGGGFFSGLISSHQFDMAYLYKPDPPFTNIIAIDDLHFGVPAPGALALLGLAALLPVRRRRIA